MTRCCTLAIASHEPVTHLLASDSAEDGSELSFDFGMMDHPGQLNNLLLKEMRRGEKPIVAAPLKCGCRRLPCAPALSIAW